MLVDALSEVRLPIQQFVDDGICVESSLQALCGVNRALTRFARVWRHAFAGGRRAPAF